MLLQRAALALDRAEEALQEFDLEACVLACAYADACLGLAEREIRSPEELNQRIGDLLRQAAQLQQ